ncbi:hypothetical protein N8I77_007967 [Diaporthe amygdali]|uniref:SAGA-associated factor 73 n=1 Tax=Phomopsis amygdali TaxID=1214568 RepID=A0AAD9W4M4_PHOAM|nr:uncharacterized protein J7T55_009628 [Diaporthe amygdali]KAJ0109296.1 hypothetical protein J7T55_009628 [Diaporthe amygdali]KAK2605095.1 hypothetical protein N8I77_007967 [Diaporthe amygdali]
MAEDRKDDEATIKVASKKNTGKGKLGGFKLKEKIPKLKEAGSQDGNVLEDKKSKSSANAAANPVPSPSEPFHELDELPRETFIKGYPMVDAPALTSCKWCKKSILMTTAVEHINGCLKIKKEKANRKKAAREARERAKEAALREERERRAEEEGITLGADGDSGDDDDDGEKVPGKTTKKVAGKKTGEGGPSGKKRKAEGEADKGPKQKKKKDEPKPKTKPKEAALDANAPIEEDDDPNAGPVDSDEETAAVMAALAKWNPQPVVPQPVFNNIRREYQMNRLQQQLAAATDNGRKNIFKVSGYGAQRLPPGHAGHRPPVPVMPVLDQEDAPGEEEDDVPNMPGSATFAPMQAQRQVSVGGPA